MRRGRRKDLYRTERDSLEGPHQEAEIQRKALRRGKNSAFSKDTYLEKERVQSKVNSLGEEQLGKLGEEEDEKGEPAIEPRRECTDLGFDLGEREEQVICHASALAMTDEARREAEI